MAKELSIEPDDFYVDLQWPSAPEAGGNRLLESSLARFEMKAGETALTAYLTDSGLKNTYLTVPTYHLVEWLAQNWWAFLYEPKKLDRGEAETDYRARHWLGTARNGFALPDALFVPSGETIEISLRQSYLRFAQLSFTELGAFIVKTADVRSGLETFIEAVLEKMTERGVKTSEAHSAWDLVRGTSKEEEPYCRLLGSMGLSPYVEHVEIDKLLETISHHITESALRDLCEAATLGSFSNAAEFTQRLSDALVKSPRIDLGALLKIAKPLDSVPKAHDWGYAAAGQARKALGIPDDNPQGRSEFFKKLGIDPKSTTDIGNPVSTVFPIQGAVSRSSKDIKLALSSGTDKEFSAARGSFLAWSSGNDDTRLVTTARTRQQRASRAFAAEMLAPADYLKKRLGRDRDISPFTLDKVSAEIGVASTIVRFQAQNNNYRILEAA
jgi:hypothetical protein